MKYNPIDIFGDGLLPLLKDIIKGSISARKEIKKDVIGIKRGYDLSKNAKEYYFKYWVSYFGLDYEAHWNDEALNNMSRWYDQIEKLTEKTDLEQKVEKAKEVRIESVLRQYFPSGNFNRSICCPLHKDKTPSLKVYPNTNSWHCFGCQEGGDPISFIMKLHNLDFKDAVDHIQYY